MWVRDTGREKEEGCRQRERERERENSSSQILAVVRTPRRSAFLRQQAKEKPAEIERRSRGIL